MQNFGATYLNDNTGHVRYAKNVGARYLGGIVRLAKFGSHIMVTYLRHNVAILLLW